MIAKCYWPSSQFTVEIFNDNDYDLDEGDVVVFDNLVVVAAKDIHMQQRGSAYTMGTFTVPKAEGLEVTTGAALYWDPATYEVTANEKVGIYIGVSAGYADIYDDEVRVILNHPLNK